MAGTSGGIVSNFSSTSAMNESVSVTEIAEDNEESEIKILSQTMNI